MRRKPKIALVQDALPFFGGAERVLAAVMEIFPEAPIYTLIYNREGFAGNNPFAGKEVYGSFLDRMPAARSHHRAYLPLYPLAIQQFDLRRYDLILTFSYAVAHGIRTQTDQLNLSYIYTPLRYAWHYYDQFLDESGLTFGIRSWAAKFMLHRLRRWDLRASRRVDHYIAVSQWVARRVRRIYQRDASVIYPPVDVHCFEPHHPRENYYVAVSRLSAYKKVPLVVEAFSELGLPLLVIGDGPQYAQLSKNLPENIRLLGWQPDGRVRDLLGRARALVHAAEEDFGIALVEAQAAGCPVIAFGKGGALETVIADKTGALFIEQSAESIIDAVERFEKDPAQYQVEDLSRNARRFSKERFAGEFTRMVMREWEGLKASGEYSEFVRE